MEHLQQLATWLGFAPDPRAELFPLVSQVVIGLFAAVIAWLLIHHGQRRAAEETRRIERAKMLHDLDREYMQILARRCVALDAGPPKPGPGPTPGEPAAIEGTTIAEADLWRFELILTRRVRWFTAPPRGDDGRAPNAYRYINGARYIRVSEGYCVDTVTLHEVIAWSKRVANGLQAKIIDPCDVADIWRNILPWAKANRFTFMAAFFDVSEVNAPVGEREEKLRQWYDTGDLRARYRWRQFRARTEAAIARLSNGGGLVRRDIPKEWSGDIAPLYLLIRTVVDQAFAQQRFEILNYIGLDAGPFPAKKANEPEPGLDPMVRSVLFRQRKDDPTMRTEEPQRPTAT